MKISLVILSMSSVLVVVLQSMSCSAPIIKSTKLEFDKNERIHGNESVYTPDSLLLQESVYKKGVLQSYTSYFPESGDKKYFQEYKKIKGMVPE